MRKGVVAAIASTSAALTILSIVGVSNAAPSRSEVTPITLDPSDPLTAPSGSTPDGRTFGPMLMTAESVSLDPYSDPQGAREFEDMLPDMVPVLSQGAQTLAGFADRRELLSQTEGSGPVAVYDIEHPDLLIGYWHFSEGYRPADGSSPVQPTSEDPDPREEGPAATYEAEG